MPTFGQENPPVARISSFCRLTRHGRLFVLVVRSFLLVVIRRLAVAVLFANAEPVFLVFLVSATRSLHRPRLDRGAVRLRFLIIIVTIACILPLLVPLVVVIFVQAFKVEISVLEIAQHLLLELIVLLIELVGRHVLLVVVTFFEESLRLCGSLGSRTFGTPTRDDLVDSHSGLWSRRVRAPRSDRAVGKEWRAHHSVRTVLNVRLARVLAVFQRAGGVSQGVWIELKSSRRRTQTLCLSRPTNPPPRPSKTNPEAMASSSWS